MNLKECPFCGSDAETKVLVNANWRPVERRWGVECTNCGASIPCKFITADGAREAWNRRSE